PAGLTFNAGPPATITGTPTTTGTTTGIIIDVKDSETTPMTAQMTYSITVNSASAGCTGMPTGHESTLSGHYAFLFQGWKGTGAGSPTAGVVSFDADATGKILGGEADVNRAAGAQNITLNSTSSDATTLYTVGEDPVASAGDIGCVVLTNSGSSGGSLKFVFGLGKKNGSGVYTKGRIIRFDDSTGSGTRGSGVMMPQDTTAFSGGNTAQLAAHFAFGLDGVDFTGGHFGIAGSLTLAPSTGALSNLTFDANDAGSLQPDVTGGTGSITSVSATTGRALLSLTAGGGTSHEAIYIVNANEFFVVQTDTFSGSPNSNPIISGRAIATGSSFSQSSLSGNYIIHLTGIDTGFSPAEADVTLGLLTFSGGTLNGTLYQYEAGNVSSTQTLSGGSYSISSPSGRTTVTNVGNHLPVLYLAAPTSNTEPISAFFVGTDTSAIFGFAEASSGTFTTAGLAGNYFFGT
ncbi:MAG: hypothetical protein ACRD41_12605, partial [Candidatus Acidiferrales bacterium]